jgi:hypothetical protein
LEGLRYVATGFLSNCGTCPANEEEKMSLLKFAALAAALLSTAPAFADDARDRHVVGAWQPLTADARYSDQTVLVFGGDGRFAALVVDDPDTLDTASGSWMLAEDEGELVLTLDTRSSQKAPAPTRYLQMLLLGDELTAYPGMEDRSPIAATPWRKVDDAFVEGSGKRASR